MSEEIKNIGIPEEEFSEILSEEAPEISEVEPSLCRFCKREINPAFDFCTYCGKSQLDIPAVIPHKEEAENEIPKAAPKKAKKKKTSKIVFLILSIVCFAIAFIMFLTGNLAILSAQSPASKDVFGSLFGSSDNSQILLAILNSVTALLSSLIFTVLGTFFEIIRRMK